MPAMFYPASPRDVRSGTVARLRAAQAALGLANVFTFRTEPTQDDDLPYAIVWNAGERTEPQGDGNVGAPSFLHRLTLVIDVMASAATDASLDGEVVNITEAIRATLMTDPDWVMLFEGLERCDTRYAPAKDAGGKLAQGMIEFELTFRSEWEPEVPHAFLQADFRTIGDPAVETLVDIPQS